jgi:dCTP deaminase
MTIKSDKWIANLSRIQNYRMQVFMAGSVLAKASLPLSQVLDLATELKTPILSLGFIGMCGFGSIYFEHNSELAPLREYLAKTYCDGVAPDSIAFSDFDASRGQSTPMIYPFFEKSQSRLEYRGREGKCPSYGLSSYGYDIRLGNKFRVADSRKRVGHTNLLDFLTFEDSASQDHLFQKIEGDAIDLLPGQFMLGVSMEWVNVPRNVMVTCMQKSTVARKGNLAFVTPLEPGWRGYITLEILNATELPMRLYAGMGIMQLVFHESDEYCSTSYADRMGKYMDQPARPVMGLMA